MKHKVVQIANLRALTRAQEAIINRAPGQPGMSVAFGGAGNGKSTAITWLANQYNAITIEAQPLWTPRWMLSDIIKEIGVAIPYLTQDRYELIRESLRLQPRPIFIDEADHIARKDLLVETLRAIHDQTKVVDSKKAGVGILLVGMAEFKKRAAARPQLFRRIVEVVEFKPPTAEDALLLARELCEVEVQEDLVAELHQRNASVGLLCNALAKVEEAAQKTGAKVLRLRDYREAHREAL